MKRARATTRRAGVRPAKPKRAAPKNRGRRGATGKPGARPAKPRTAARRTAARRTAARRTAARRTVAPRAAAKTGRPALRVVRRTARRKPRPAPPPAFPQAQGASARSRLMFHMVKARASVLAAVQGMSAASAERPLAQGKWSTRETILHLVARDRARLREMEAALRGVRPSWQGLDPVGQARVNEEDLGPLRQLAWEDAKRLLLTTRQELMEAVESIPEAPEEVWGEEHPLGWMFQRLPVHDLHHADIIKRWRTEHGA